MYCSRCGSEIKDGKTFCFVCGCAVSQVDAAVENMNPSGELMSLTIKHKSMTEKCCVHMARIALSCEKERQSCAESCVFDDVCLKLADLSACVRRINECLEHAKSLLENCETHDDNRYSIGSAISIVEVIISDLRNVESLIGLIEKMMHIYEVENPATDFVTINNHMLNFVNQALHQTYSELSSARRRLIGEPEPMPGMMPDQMCVPTASYTPARSAQVGTKGAEKRRFRDLFKRRKEPKPETLILPDDLFVPDIPGEHAADKTSSVKLSEVDFSAVVKKRVGKSEYIPVDIVMYEREFRNVVDAMLDSLHQEKVGGHFEVFHQTKIRVVLSSTDVDIDDCEEERIWQGNYLEFSFAVPVPETYAKKQILIVAKVYINEIMATDLKLIVDVDSGECQNRKPERTDITSAFVSYASKDRKRVAAIVQGMQKARPDMDVFFDVESLRSGQEWKTALETEIDERSIFYLCWSKAASQSEWVDFEWRYALKRKGESMIEPIPIDPPEFCPPPPELCQKHFNDRLLYLIKALDNME